MNGRKLICPIEELCREDGWVVVHDGQETPHNDGLRQLSPPGETKFFTRLLQKKRDGEFVDKWLKFTYDLRSKYCVDVVVITKTPEGIKRRQKLRQVVY